MNAYGGTCPICCGDLDDVAGVTAAAAVCQFCRNIVRASQSKAREPMLDSIPLRMSGVAERLSQQLIPGRFGDVEGNASMTVAEG